MKTVIALAGNPNCGKTTLFNELTGSSQYVGNWPGVTVEKKEGLLKGRKDVIIQDLPGIYSLSPYSPEEAVARDYLLVGRPDAVINIIDATNLERNLYLTTQLTELGIPVVIALNMTDILRKRGDVIDEEKLGKEFGCRVVSICALKGDGMKKLTDAALGAAAGKKAPDGPEIFTGSVGKAIEAIEDEIRNAAGSAALRWHAVKVLEGEVGVSDLPHLSAGAEERIEAAKEKCAKASDEDPESLIIGMRYDFIKKSAGRAVLRTDMPRTLSVTDMIDRIVTNRVLAFPIFALVMFLVYYISVTTVGSAVTDWTNETLFGSWIQPAVQHGLEAVGASEWVVSLVVSGIIGGLAAPLGFVPQMALVFLFLSLLEDCGYMARVAFIMDRIFRRFGLSGKSFIPFLISSGCGVPGILASRTIENEKDRRMTMITTTFIPCGAKLPVIAVISGYLAGGAWWAAPGMYFAGIAAVIISCVILKKTKMFAGDPAPFVMEMPQYLMPSAKGVLIHVWERVRAFLKKAGTVLFLCCVVMWFLGSFGYENGSFGLTAPENSILSHIGGAVAWLFVPLGFGTWQAVASSFSGFTAKESIVTTMGVLAGLGEIENYSASMHSSFAAFFPTGIAAVSFLVFNMFDSPCLAAISTLAKEMGSRRYFWFALLFQNIVAYSAALMVYQIGGLITGEVAFGPAAAAAFILAAVIMYLLFRKDPGIRRGKGELSWQHS